MRPSEVPQRRAHMVIKKLPQWCEGLLSGKAPTRHAPTLETGGLLFFHALTGPMRDTLAANALRKRLLLDNYKKNSIVVRFGRERETD